jgi:hypothetical protein
VPHWDAYDGYLAPNEDQPWPLTEEAAAEHVGRSRRTIREWRARGVLDPIAQSYELTGQYLYWPVDVVRAERDNKGGRTRRTAGQRLHHSA